MKLRNFIIAAIMAFAIVIFTSSDVKSFASAQIKSNGRFIFNNNTAETADDVIFDSADVITLHNMVTDLESKVAAAEAAY